MRYKDCYNEEVYRKYAQMSEHEINVIKRYFDVYDERFYLKNVENGYQYYCPVCQKWHEISKETYREINNARICAFCGNSITTITRIIKSKEISELILIDRDDYVCGYMVEYHRDFNKTSFNYYLAYVSNPYVRQDTVYGIIVGGMGYSSIVKRLDKQEWRLTRSRGYRYGGYDYERMDNHLKHLYKTRKEYYQLNGVDKLNLKSNQIYLLKHHVLYMRQVMYLKLFNLNDVSKLYKLKKYINANRWVEDYLNYQLTEHCLDYLVDNNINLVEYIDYIRDCELLGITDRKYPKDFANRHYEVSKLVKLKENELTCQKIVELSSSLENFKFTDNKYVISPFETFEELQNEGDKQKICIASYAKKYGDGNTYLFKIRRNKSPEVPLAALEFKNNKIIQVRAKCNAKPTDDVLNFVKKWCKYISKQLNCDISYN